LTHPALPAKEIRTSPQNKRTVTARAVEPSSLLEWDIKYISNRWPSLLKKLKEQAWKHLAQYYESAPPLL
jgi:hypothetical protein